MLCYGFKIADNVYRIHLRFKLFKTIEQLFAVVKNEVLHIYFSGAEECRKVLQASFIHIT